MELNKPNLNKVNKLHYRYKTNEQWMIIVPLINHTHYSVIFEYCKVKVFKYIDCFSKNACVIIVSQKASRKK